MKKNRLLIILLALLVFGPTAWAQGLSGSGTSADPYLITSTTDWNTFASNVTNGTTYSGQFLKLTADISVTTMAGTDSNRFRGTFDGGGHTMTLALSASEHICAPFRYINGATIKRLKIGGTITGNSYKQLAGIVGMAYGTNNISNCWVDATFTSTFSGDSSISGLAVQIITGTTNFSCCLFSGTFNCPNAKCLGGFVGWTSNNATGNYSNCLFKPASVTIGSTDGCSTFARLAGSGYANFDKAYYGNNLFVTNQGTNGTSMNATQLQAALGLGWETSGNSVVPVMSPRPLTGDGTYQSPYQIATDTDWNTLAWNVNNSGETYSGQYFEMTTDITISEMIGISSNRFGGTFNGGGHTLTFNKGTSSNRFGEGNCAPFRYINGATIKCLYVAGSIYTSNQFAAVVARANGNNTISNCRSGLIIDSTKDGDGTHGGFIGVVESGSTTFINCLFDGQLIGSATTNCGGFVGWTSGNNGARCSITNCLFAPTTVSFSTSGAKTFSRMNADGNATFSNSYYTQTLGDAQGTPVGSMNNDELRAALGSYWEISNGKVVPVMSAFTLSGSGSESVPYLIASALDWDKLACNVNLFDMSYSGEYFKVTDDITVSTAIGSESNPFMGIFDGDGKTLNLNIVDYSNYGTAPFRGIANATIQNVRTTGIVIGTMHCAGLVGFAMGTTNLIQDCEVAASVNCCGNSHTHCGGIVGHASNSNTTVQDCLFSGAIDGATNTTGIILGWGGNDGTFAIGNCLSTGDYSGCSGTILLIANRGTWTCANSYRKTSGPTDGIDASGMSNAELLIALGSEWGTRGRNVVPTVFATSGGEEGVASVDEESTYTPTQIINGKFATRPWMDYQINGTRITELNTSYSDQTIEASFPNGVNGGWNTTENKVYYGGLFEYMETIGGYNPNIPNFGNYVEMNAHHSAVLSQDLSTHEHDVIRWSLLHAVRTNYSPDVQSMQVEVGAPQYDGENIVAATGIDDAVDSKITDATKATYTSAGYSGSYAQGGDNLAKLALSKTSAEDNSTWHTVRGIYMIPDGQTVTRFAFIATSANTRDGGNLLDNLEFSTLIGNLSAQQVANGDVILKGYWGETDESKQLIVETGSTTQSIDMNYVTNENFKITIPASSIGNSTTLTVYHEDYPAAGRTIELSLFTKEITAYNTGEDGWYLISSPIGTVNPENVINMTENTFDIYRFNQNPEETTTGEVTGFLEWENWKKEENVGETNHYHFDLEPCRGYLYANSSDVTLTFIGTPYSGDGVVTLSYSNGNPDTNMHGWNLIGNPFSTAATFSDKAFYRMNPGTHAELILADNTSVEAMEGIFVHADSDGETVTFTTGAKRATDSNNQIVVNLSHESDLIIDRAIVRFGEGETLPKFQIRDNSTKLYIPQGGKDYAVVRSNVQGELPVCFMPAEDGTYTLAVNTKDLEMEYLHLIDNMTGADVDLLATPDYTFEARYSDYASRFRLVFSSNSGDTDDAFAFFDGSAWVIGNEGRATLQVIDMLGHVLHSETIDDNATISTNGLGAGVYVMRLVNGEEVRVQKIVVR